LKSGSLPAYRVNNHYRFNRAELLEWATSRQINVPADVFREPNAEEGPMHSLSEALSLGGIYYRIEGNDKESALRNVVALMRLPEEVDREFLLQVLLAREALASTAIGDGIAIPHVRNPIVLHVTEPLACLSFLERPIDFNALDGKPVTCLFTLVSPTVKAHLHLLSRLAYTLRDKSLKRLLDQQGSREEILAEIARIESSLRQDDPAPKTGEES
jgi:PTS system nitrogen regulatory IIA component